jgi:hypothetical protein
MVRCSQISAATWREGKEVGGEGEGLRGRVSEKGTA